MTTGWFDSPIGGGPQVFDRWGRAAPEVWEAERAGNVFLTSYGSDFPLRAGLDRRLPLWHAHIPNPVAAPETVLCVPGDVRVGDTDRPDGGGRVPSALAAGRPGVTPVVPPGTAGSGWLEAGAFIGVHRRVVDLTWPPVFPSDSLRRPGLPPGVVRPPINIFEDPRGPNGNWTLGQVDTAYGCAALGIQEMVHEVTDDGRLRARCPGGVYEPVVLRYVTELRCEPDLFESPGRRAGLYDAFGLSAFISPEREFTSGSPRRQLDDDPDDDEHCNIYGCTRTVPPAQHPTDYAGPEPWVRRLEAALLLISGVNETTGPAAVSAQPRAVVVPQPTVNPLPRFAGGDYRFADRPQSAIERLWSARRAGRLINTPKGPDCLRFADPLDPINPCLGGGPVDPDADGLLPSVVARSPRPDSVLRPVQYGQTAGRTPTRILAPSPDLPGSVLAVNQASGACLFFQYAPVDLVAQAAAAAAAARDRQRAAILRIAEAEQDGDHDEAVEAMIDLYHAQWDERAWRHIEGQRRPYGEQLIAALTAAGYTEFGLPATFPNPSRHVAIRHLGNPALRGPLLAQAGPGANRCYTGFPGYLPASRGPGAGPAQHVRNVAPIDPSQPYAAGTPVVGDAVGQWGQPVDAVLEAAAGSLGLEPFNRVPATGLTEASRAYATGLPSRGALGQRAGVTPHVPPIGRGPDMPSAAAADAFAADRGLLELAAVPLDLSPDPLAFPQRPGPLATITFSCPTFATGVFNPDGTFGTFTSSGPAADRWTGALSTDRARRSPALSPLRSCRPGATGAGACTPAELAERARTSGVANRWCPRGAAAWCDPFEDPQHISERITVPVPYSVTAPVTELYWMEFTPMGGFRYPASGRTPLISWSIYFGDAPLRSLSPDEAAVRLPGPQTPEEWARRDYWRREPSDPAFGQIPNDAYQLRGCEPNDCADHFLGGWVHWHGDVAPPGDPDITGPCVFALGDRSLRPDEASDGRLAPSVLQPDASLRCAASAASDNALGCK